MPIGFDWGGRLGAVWVRMPAVPGSLLLGPLSLCVGAEWFRTRGAASPGCTVGCRQACRDRHWDGARAIALDRLAR